jgi:hypothetical protein
MRQCLFVLFKVRVDRGWEAGKVVGLCFLVPDVYDKVYKTSVVDVHGVDSSYEWQRGRNCSSLTV